MKKTKAFKYVLLINVFCFSYQGWAETMHASADSLQQEFQADLNSYEQHIENDVNSVQTLMRLETMQAISAASGSNAPIYTKQVGLSNLNSKAINNDVGQIHKPYLKSIYGVGNKLKAKVNYKQQDFVYKKGQQHPIGTKPSLNNVLLMTDFSDLCITLVGANNSYDLCLNNY